MDMNEAESWKQTSAPAAGSKASRKELQEQAESASSPLWLQTWYPPPHMQNLIIKEVR